MRVRTYGFPGCFTRPPGTSTRHHPHEPTASKPVVPGDAATHLSLARKRAARDAASKTTRRRTTRGPAPRGPRASLRWWRGLTPQWPRSLRFGHRVSTQSNSRLRFSQGLPRHLPARSEKKLRGGVAHTRPSTFAKPVRRRLSTLPQWVYGQSRALSSAHRAPVLARSAPAGEAVAPPRPRGPLRKPPPRDPRNRPSPRRQRARRDRRARRQVLRRHQRRRCCCCPNSSCSPPPARRSCPSPPTRCFWGWTFALGFVVLLFIHEMGHVIQLRREGIKASAPMFIPFLGAHDHRQVARRQRARRGARRARRADPRHRRLPPSASASARPPTATCSARSPTSASSSTSSTCCPSCRSTADARWPRWRRGCGSSASPPSSRCCSSSPTRSSSSSCSSAASRRGAAGRSASRARSSRPPTTASRRATACSSAPSTSVSIVVLALGMDAAHILSSGGHSFSSL